MIMSILLLANTIIADPGVGQSMTLGQIKGTDDVEVRSGKVAASLDGSYGGIMKVSGGTFELTNVGESTEELKFTSKSNGKEAIPFVVRKNEEFDWLEVTPSQGVMPAQGETEFTVSLKTNVMTNRHFYRGAFFVTTTNGLSRPFSVSAETEFIPPFQAEKPGDIAIYADVNKPIAGSKESGEAEYAFEVPRAGTYWFLIHGGAASKPTINAAVDDDEYASSKQQTHTYPTWTMIAPGKIFGDYMRAYQLTKGRHTIRIKVGYSSFKYDGLVLTDNPEAFEPR